MYTLKFLIVFYNLLPEDFYQTKINLKQHSQAIWEDTHKHTCTISKEKEWDAAKGEEKKKRTTISIPKLC